MLRETLIKKKYHEKILKQFFIPNYFGYINITHTQKLKEDMNLNRTDDTIQEINNLCNTYDIKVTHTEMIANEVYVLTIDNVDDYNLLITLLENGWRPTIVTHTQNNEAFLKVSFYFE